MTTRATVGKDCERLRIQRAARGFKKACIRQTLGDGFGKSAYIRRYIDPQWKKPATF